MMNELDTKNRIYQAERRARAEALAEGREEGKAERDREIAINMLAEGMKDDLVAKLTGLKIEDVSALRRESL